MTPRPSAALRHRVRDEHGDLLPPLFGRLVRRMTTATTWWWECAAVHDANSLHRLMRGEKYSLGNGNSQPIAGQSAASEP